jgi:hypothetical protein
MPNEQQKTCYCKTNLVESKVVIEPGSGVLCSWMTEKQRGEALERWAREIHEFLHDHRSMDVNGVRVDHEFEKVCSACGNRWEEQKFEAEGDEPAYVGCSYCCVPLRPNSSAAAS